MRQKYSNNLRWCLKSIFRVQVNYLDLRITCLFINGSCRYSRLSWMSNFNLVIDQGNTSKWHFKCQLYEQIYEYSYLNIYTIYIICKTIVGSSSLTTRIVSYLVWIYETLSLLDKIMIISLVLRLSNEHANYKKTTIMTYGIVHSITKCILTVAWNN